MFKSLYEYYLKNIPHKGKRHIVKWSLFCLPFKSLRTHYGPIFKVNHNDKTNIYGLCGEYGNVVSDYIRSLPKGSSFIDIGANHGLFSLMASNQLGDDGRVFSFEPNPFIYSYFIENIKLNKCKNILPIQSAVSVKTNILNLIFDSNHSGKSHVSNISMNNTIKVLGLNLSRLDFLTKEIGARDVHIKIDVEGYEANILKALILCDWFKSVKSMVIEIDQSNLSLFGNNVEQDIYDLLREKGFSCKIGMDTEKHYDEIFIRT